MLPITDLHLMHIGLNELYMVHRLCDQYRHHLAPDPNDPLNRILTNLQSVPNEVCGFRFVYLFQKLVHCDTTLSFI